MTRLGVVLSLVALAGCGARQNPEGDLQPPDRFVGEFMLQQDVIFHRGEVEQSLQTALQVRDGRLTLIGLTPLGTRAFVLQQNELDVNSESHLPEELPFPPRLILVDIQRTLLPLPGTTPMGDGERRARVNGVVVRERWQGGRLVERVYRLRRPAGEIRITYRDGYLFGRPPGNIIIENTAMGYRLELIQLAYRDL